MTIKERNGLAVRRRQARLRSKGLCVQCGAAGAEGWRCAECRNKLAALRVAREQRRREGGLCLRCGQASATAQCDFCSSKRASAARARAASGRCVRCGEATQDRAPRYLCGTCAKIAVDEHYRRFDEARRRVLELLGGRCACSREDCFHAPSGCPVDDERVLTVDHVNGDGAAHVGNRRRHPGKWKAYLGAVESESHVLQLLCPTCHAVKDLNRGARGRRRGKLEAV